MNCYEFQCCTISEEARASIDRILVNQQQMQGISAQVLNRSLPNMRLLSLLNRFHLPSSSMKNQPIVIHLSPVEFNPP